ncbi:CD209 antigen-like protein C isoform 1-T1 [Spinachia spinachia]
MAKFMRKEESGITRDYVNLPEPRSDTQQHDGGTDAVSGRKLFKLVAVSFGLLCILQAALNVSLRLAPFLVARHTNLTEETKGLRRELLPFDRYFQEGWVYVRPSFYYISSSKKPWLESRNDCLNRGADLVVINSRNEQDFARKFELQYTWIGLTSGDTNNSWIWVDGTPLSKRLTFYFIPMQNLLSAIRFFVFRFSYWGPGEPNNFLGSISRNEKCVEIRLHEVENSWNDVNCEAQNYWICEKMIAS